jgi:hypothetical protein
MPITIITYPFVPFLFNSFAPCLFHPLLPLPLPPIITIPAALDHSRNDGTPVRDVAWHPWLPVLVSTGWDGRLVQVFNSLISNSVIVWHRDA